MSVQVGGDGKVTQQGDATEFGNGTDPVTKAAPTQGSVAVEEGTAGRPAHWPTAKGEDGEFVVKSEADMEGWYKQAMEDAQSGKTTEEAKAPEAKATEEAPKVADPKEPLAKVEEPKPAVLTDDQIRENLKAAGGIYADPKYEPFAVEVERTGALSEESVAKAAEAFGVPPEYVKTFVDGQIATKKLAASEAQTAVNAKVTEQNTKVAETILSVIPDPANYDAMMKWASGSDTVDADTKAAYDKALASGDTQTLKVLVRGLHTQWQAEGQAEPARRDITQGRAVTDRSVQTPTAKPFSSRSQMTTAMADPRYARDPEYRLEVNTRVGVSEFGE